MGRDGTYKTSDRLVPGKLQKNVEALENALASSTSPALWQTTTDMQQEVVPG